MDQVNLSLKSTKAQLYMSYFYSKFIKRKHLSYRLPSKAKSYENLKSKFSAGVNFINTVRNSKIPPGKIAAIDKTRFNSETKKIKHISIKGGYTIFLFYLYLSSLILVKILMLVVADLEELEAQKGL